MNALEALKKDWETRKKELKENVGRLQAQLAYAGYYNQAQIQQEGVRLHGVS